MKVTRIFFALMLGIVAISCEEEVKSDMIGQWSITWKSGQSELNGDIHFTRENAYLKAFGKSESPLLQEYSEMNYSWSISGDKLILLPAENTHQLEFTILQRSEKYIQLHYLEDIVVSIERN